MHVSSALISPFAARSYRFVSGDDAGGPSNKAHRFDRPVPGSEDLPYRIELWDEKKTSVEQILAVTANGSIGYAAYYAATREHPDRFVTLRHHNSVLSRFNPPER
jgi:hypothetical protein